MEKNKKVIIIICVCIIVLIYYAYSWIADNNLKVVTEDELVKEETENSTEENEIKEEPKKIIVHVTGEVANQGIVELNENSRVVDAIEKAGGATENADLARINLAYILQDGLKIYIPSINDEESKNDEYIYEDYDDTTNIENSKEKEKKSMININNAAQTELETLPGIGPSTALKIIQYRNENGKFKDISDIKNVNRYRG